MLERQCETEFPDADMENLVYAEAVRFLLQCEAQGIRLAQCFAYIREVRGAAPVDGYPRWPVPSSAMSPTLSGSILGQQSDRWRRDSD